MKKALLLSVALCACTQLTNDSDPPKTSATWPEASGSVANRLLAELCVDVWESELRLDPIFATLQSDPRYHGQLPDISAGGVRNRLRVNGRLLSRAEGIDASALSPSEAITHAMLVEHLENKLRLLEAGLY